MQIDHVGDRRYARFPRLAAEAGLSHAFSTRPADVSAREDDRAEERQARREQMAADLGLDPRRLCYTVQTHETRIAVIDDDWFADRVRLPEAVDRLGNRLPGYDAVMTNLPGVPLMTFSADCPLVLAYCPRRRAVGMVHSSWRCTVAYSTRRLIEAMAARFGCDPREIQAGIGPSAGPTQYEVKQDVFDAAAGLADRDRLFPRHNGRMFFDLWEANRLQLLEAGVAERNIEIAGVCTMTDRELFYSFRREGPGCGHFGLLAGLV